MEINNEVENTDETMDPNININSWIFIEKDATDTPTSTRRVEDLTENDLKSIDSNSDSDGISVISETEEQQSQDECCTCISKIKDSRTDIIDKNDAHNSTEDNSYTDADCIENYQIISKDLVPINKVVLFTTMTGMCFLATYLFFPKSVDSPKFISINISSEPEHDYPNGDMTYDFLDTVYDNQILMHYSNNTCYSDLFDDNLNVISTDSFLDEIDYSVNGKMFIPVEPILFQSKNQNEDTKKSINLNEKSTQNKHVNKINKSLKSKEKYKKDKYLLKKEKYLKKLEKEVHKLEAKLRQTYRHLKKDFDNHVSKNKFNIKKEFKLNPKKLLLQHNVTGDWYHKMYSSRSELRYKEKLSEWIFERSKMRSNLRDKDNGRWYFSRAKGREQFRFNEKFRPKNNKVFKNYRY